MDRLPDPVEHPKLAYWLFARELKASQVCARLGVSDEQVRRYCRPFGHRDRATPSADVLSRISDMTGGEVTERDFYPPHIRGERPAFSVVEGGAS